MIRANVSCSSRGMTKDVDCHCESSVLSICHWFKEADIALLNEIFTSKVAQRKAAPTSISQARWPDMELALPNLVLPRHHEYDICIFAWQVLVCIILTYYLVEK